jgi:hypothetical protein
MYHRKGWQRIPKRNFLNPRVNHHMFKTSGIELTELPR